MKKSEALKNPKIAKAIKDAVPIKKASAKAVLKDNTSIIVKGLSKLLNAEIVPEYSFFIGRKWRIDFFIKKGGTKIALEIEGGVWTKGRHITPQGFLKDMEKYNSMTMMGIFLIRCTPSDIKVLPNNELWVSPVLLNTLLISLK